MHRQRSSGGGPRGRGLGCAADFAGNGVSVEGDCNLLKEWIAQRVAGGQLSAKSEGLPSKAETLRTAGSHSKALGESNWLSAFALMLRPG